MRAQLRPDVPSNGLKNAVAGVFSHDSLWWRVLRGYTAAERWIVRDSSKRSAFIKVATDEQTASWLRSEAAVYSSVAAPWMPACLGWIDDSALPGPILILENLHDASWPPRWTPRTTEMVAETIRSVHKFPIPAGLPKMDHNDRRILDGWTRIAENPGRLLEKSFLTERWLYRALGPLVEASSRAVLEGEALLHLDIRSDNLCIDRGQVKIFDWNWAGQGNPMFDLCAWLPSLEAEGGPPPEQIVHDQPEIAAALAGYFCYQLTLPDPDPKSGRRSLQTRQARSALPWAARVLGLDEPFLLGAGPSKVVC